MLNQMILVGRLTRDVEVHKSESGMSVATISLAIPRPYKNNDGEQETDFIDCTAFDSVAENTSEYCNKGDIVGIKGKIQSRIVENESGRQNTIDIIAEKITFISSIQKHEQEKTDEAT